MFCTSTGRKERLKNQRTCSKSPELLSGDDIGSLLELVGWPAVAACLSHYAIFCCFSHFFAYYALNNKQGKQHGGMNMAISIRLDEDFVTDVKIYADVSSRSVPKQIEHWAKIGRIVEDNPDLPYGFILETLLAKREIEKNKVSRYVRRTKRTEG